MIANKKLTIILNEATPYHDILLDYLYNMKDIDLDVNYLVSKLKHHPWKLCNNKYNALYINNFANKICFIVDKIRSKPNLVIVGNFFSITCLIYYLLFKLTNIRFVPFSDTPNININRAFIRKYVRHFIIRWLYNNAEAILTTGGVGIVAHKAMGCPEEKLKNLPFSVDLSTSLESSEKARGKIKSHYNLNDEIIFLCAGQLIPRKQYNLAIKAFHKAISKNFNRGAILLIAGDGPQRKFLQELSSDLGIADKIYFLGWCQPRQMKELFAASDILIHPAQWDAYPVAVLEALANGMPVLASDRSMSAVDRVRQGESGFIHSVDNWEELSNHITYFLDNPAKIAPIGAQARAMAEQWPVSRCVQTILDLL